MWLSLILIILAFTGLGWYFGHNKRVVSKDNLLQQDNKVINDYFVGLKHLINEETDKAVDVFVKVLNVDSNTVEMHLVLGSLFRRKGEVDRAIKIHANLIARPQLSKEQRCNAILELAQDYLKAGVLDRAEKLFLDLIAINEEDVVSYQFLLNLYEKQKDWRQAINIAQKLNEFKQENTNIIIAHYYCELADEAKNSGLTDQAEIYFKKALAYDKRCVRASIGLGFLLEIEGNYKIALKFYKKIAEQDSCFLTEVTSNIAFCHKNLNYEPQELIDFFKNILDKNPKNTSLLLFFLQYVQESYDQNTAIDFINKYNLHNSDLLYVTHLFRLYLTQLRNDNAHINLNENNILINLDLIYSLLQQNLKDKAKYKCCNCGLSTKQLYWQCPGCRRWSSIKQI